ncbi:hypothetical protein TESG_08577 [Trichophyton tonsurans CBS 112818]|uniref:Uncharacterized protein n=1 Tax=Trichophyton tonsurans (strain CBS 112818) TaxID=647933 RepID=F2S655_TRIT1|nr:hypothetical protein TESG_08577 [Trichophyton tonsurans CBS 112818]
MLGEALLGLLISLKSLAASSHSHLTWHFGGGGGGGGRSMYRPVIRFERDAGLLYGMRYWLDLSPAIQSIHGLWTCHVLYTSISWIRGSGRLHRHRPKKNLPIPGIFRHRLVDLAEITRRPDILQVVRKYLQVLLEPPPFGTFAGTLLQMRMSSSVLL